MSWAFANSQSASVAIAAGTQTAVTGTVVMSNANGITFGMSGNSRVTASYAPIAVSAAGSSVAGATVVFSNSNNVSFGMSGSTITATATPPSASFFDNPAGGAINGTNSATFDSANVNMSLQRFYVPAAISATRLDYIGSLTAAGSQASSTMSVALYTRSVSTLNRASSTTAGVTWDATTTASAAGNYGGQSGLRIRSVALGTWALTPGEYWVGLIHSASGTGAGSNVGLSLLGASTVNFSLPGGGNDVVGEVGMYSAATGAPPAAITLSQVNWTGSAALAQPYFRMYGTH